MPSGYTRPQIWFLFCESERIPRRDTPQFLKVVLSFRSPADVPQKVVLLGYTISVELDIMEKIGINLRDDELFSIGGSLEISTTIREDVGHKFNRRRSLERILECLGIPFQKRYFHNTKNDAYFTLRVQPVLAAIGFERLKLEDVQRARISDLKSIALASIDFDSPTPDGRLRADENSKKTAAAAAQ
jgi:hypothetical protein